MQQALANDELKKAAVAAGKLSTALKEVDMELFEGEAHMRWMKAGSQLQTLLQQFRSTGDIQEARKQFALISDLMADLADKLRPFEITLYRMHCPMAFENRGADWLQADSGVSNPYYGKVMLGCGDVVKVIPAAGKTGGASHE